MKKIISIILVSLVVSVVIVSCGPTTDSALKYNDALVQEQTKVFNKESALQDAISRNQQDKLDLLYNDMVKQIDESMNVVVKMDAFDGKTELKNAALRILRTYKDVSENEYKEMIKHYETPDSLYTQEDDDKVIDLSGKIDEKLNKAVDEFVQIQKGFANKYKFDLKAPEEKDTVKIKK